MPPVAEHDGRAANHQLALLARSSAAQAIRSEPSAAGCINAERGSPVCKVLTMINFCWEMLTPFLPGDTNFLRLGGFRVLHSLSYVRKIKQIINQLLLKTRRKAWRISSFLSA